MNQVFIYSPGGNITALLEGFSGDLVCISKRIIFELPHIEQVGFIQSPISNKNSFHLEMMGGEFCANAARCAAYRYMQLKNSQNVKFSVSGFAEPLSATMQAGVVSLFIPGSLYVRTQIKEDFCIIDLQGIRFLVTQSPELTLNRSHMISEYCENFSAIGFLLLTKQFGMNSIQPWVWVKSIGEIILETSCGSGSIAAALSLSSLALSNQQYSIKQPSGSLLNVSLFSENLGLKKITLSGHVRFLGTENLI